MSRLLFAAARGARVQYRIADDIFVEGWGKWVDGHFVAWSKPYQDDYDFRIHPDDAHLQYGPISTALREMATEKHMPTEYVMAAFSITNYLEHAWMLRWDDTLHRSLFLLILAEALADEGL